VALATTLVNASAARAAAKASLSGAVQAEAKSIAQDGAILREARDSLTLMFNSVPETQAAFLITPRKPNKPLTTEERAAATAKLRATRLARGTTSKQQKAKVTGNVTGVVITPVTAPAASPAATPTSGAAAPAASAAPAPVATPAASNAPAAATPVTRS
jgi:glutamate-1-semialdehyde aminotransferase